MSALGASFSSPSPQFGPVPFWWWVGEPLDRSRLLWQLDRLNEKGVRNAIISYNHHGDGAPNRGEPAVFSRAWWDLLRDMLEECRVRGMQLSFQDYTLLNPTLEEIGKERPYMLGTGELREAHVRLASGEETRLKAENADGVLAAFAYPVRGGRAVAEAAVELTGSVVAGELTWRAPATEREWLLSLVWVRPTHFDPLHPESGRLVIERFYAPFEREVGEHLGTTLPISFQDELSFGGSMPRWSRVLPVEFLARKGYALAPVLAALWHDLGPISPKLRIDYADVVTRLLEERYFIPVYEWHERLGLLFGNDNQGRGGIESGMRAYGDAFRTMRWYSAPGTDDPNLAGARAFKGLKVNSSIAHLYRRPRVWNECFHSSGWGTSPADVIAALNADFILGATVVNLHGLYYSTFGSWWEWAPPDFHFRQPYWEHLGALSGHATRLCEMLSQGVHVCDVAIVYPITALEGGLNPRVDASADLDVPVSERQAGKTGDTLDAAEAAAFGIGRRLLEAGVDFDFVDFESLERAEIADGEIRVSGERYLVLVLPWMSALRMSTLRAAARFVRAGGLVVFFGCTPVASEQAGANDPEVATLLTELLAPGKREGRGKAIFVPEGFQPVFEAVVAHAGRDFDPAGTGFQAVHRRSAEQDIYFVYNPSRREVAGAPVFRAAGHAEHWNTWTGERQAAGAETLGENSQVHLRLAAGEGALLVFDRMRPAAPPAITGLGQRPPKEVAKRVEGLWDCELIPTLDNQFGDFRRPAFSGAIGPEARRFRHAEEAADGAPGWERADFGDQDWPEVTYSHGQRFWKLGPIEPGADISEIERETSLATRLDFARPVLVGGKMYRWKPYVFSLRWGVENDPHLTDWASGPHGLKGEVPDEFIDLHAEQAGAKWLLWTCIKTDEARREVFTTGSRARYATWLNGEPVLSQEEELPPGRQSEWNLPHYQCTPKTCPVDLEAGANALLLSLVQPAGQRTRAFAAFAPPADASQSELALRWFAWSGHPRIDPRPGAELRAHWYRFDAPPGLRAINVVSRAPVRAWAAGRELTTESSRMRADGLLETRVVAACVEPQACVVALRVEASPGCYGGDPLPEPVSSECGLGLLNLGDWCGQGLAHYSGIVCYRKELWFDSVEVRDARHLDLGEVAATAEVRINGLLAATLIAPPWRVSVAGLLRTGQNEIEVRVANTLANHYRVGIPTPYAPAEQTRAGLLGPVRIVF